MREHGGCTHVMPTWCLRVDEAVARARSFGTSCQRAQCCAAECEALGEVRA
jgi:hypothetical protein